MAAVGARLSFGWSRNLIFGRLKLPSLSIRINRLIWIEKVSDTWNLRQHGCQQTLIANRQRWGLLCETPDLQEPDPIALASHLVACDLVLAVGFDHTPLPGLETLRADNPMQPLYSRDVLLQTVVSNDAGFADVQFRFLHNAIEELADHILIHAVAIPD